MGGKARYILRVRYGWQQVAARVERQKRAGVKKG